MYDITTETKTFPNGIIGFKYDVGEFLSLRPCEFNIFEKNNNASLSVSPWDHIVKVGITVSQCEDFNNSTSFNNKKIDRFSYIANTFFDEETYRKHVAYLLLTRNARFFKLTKFIKEFNDELWNKLERIKNDNVSLIPSVQTFADDATYSNSLEYINSYLSQDINKKVVADNIEQITAVINAVADTLRQEDLKNLADIVNQEMPLNKVKFGISCESNFYKGCCCCYDSVLIEENIPIGGPSKKYVLKDIIGDIDEATCLSLQKTIVFEELDSNIVSRGRFDLTKFINNANLSGDTIDCNPDPSNLEEGTKGPCSTGSLDGNYAIIYVVGCWTYYNSATNKTVAYAEMIEGTGHDIVTQMNFMKSTIFPVDSNPVFTDIKYYTNKGLAERDRRNRKCNLITYPEDPSSPPCDYPCIETPFPSGTCIEKHWMNKEARFKQPDQPCPILCRDASGQDCYCS